MKKLSGASTLFKHEKGLFWLATDKGHCLLWRTLKTFLLLLNFADKRASDGIQASPQMMNAIATPGSHARSTSYSVSYCTKKTNLPIENKGELYDIEFQWDLELRWQLKFVKCRLLNWRFSIFSLYQMLRNKKNTQKYVWWYISVKFHRKDLFSMPIQWNWAFRKISQNPIRNKNAKLKNKKT